MMTRFLSALKTAVSALNYPMSTRDKRHVGNREGSHPQER